MSIVVTRKFISWNVNGIRAVYKKGFIDWVKKENPDFLCIQETKANPDQLNDDLKQIPGYISIFSSAEKKGYSGTALYTKIPPVSIENSFSKNSIDREGRIIIAKYSQFTLMNLYYPNGKSSNDRLKFKLKFYNDFVDHILRHKKEKFIICGDVNTAHNEIDLAHPRENKNISGFLPEERQWLDRFLSQAGLIDTFRKFNKEPNNYTWWDQKSRARERNVGWRIDYFYISKSLEKDIKTAFILKDVMGSDHCPIGIKIDASI